MINWKDGVDKRLFYSNYNKDDLVMLSEDIMAASTRGGQFHLKKGMQMK